MNIGNIRSLSGILLVVVTLALQSADGSTLQLADHSPNTDTVHEAEPKRSNMRFTGRVHSLGLFGYAGQIANENPSADVTFTYDRKHWGVMVIKAADVYDLHSFYNFALGLLYSNVRLTPNLTLTPYGGFALEQNHQFAGHGSDAMGLLITTYRLDKTFSIEHCARFSGFVIDPRFFDWLNRLKFTYSREHIDLAITGWHNNNVFDKTWYTTVGFNAAYSRIRISEKVTMSSGLTALVTAHASENMSFVKKNALLLTISTTVD